MSHRVAKHPGRDTKQPGFWLLWVMNVFVIAGSHSHWMTESARVVRPATVCVLVPSDVWQVPLARWSAASAVMQWPYIVYVIAAATLVTATCRFLKLSAPFPWFAALGLSLVIQPGNLLCACLLSLVAAIKMSPRLAARPLTAGMLIALCGLLSILCVLDYGIVLLATLWALLMIVRDSKSSGLFGGLTYPPLVLSVVAMLLGVILLPGFTAALLRPISWIWTPSVSVVMSSMAVSLVSFQHGLPVILLVVVGGTCWAATLREDSRTAIIPLLVYSVIGLGCLRYLFLGGFAVVTYVRGQERTGRLSQRGRRIITTCLLMGAFLRLIWNTDPLFLLTGDSSPRLLNPTQWRTSGGVLLLNLDHADDWWAEDVAARFPLMIDDRWDVFGDLYPTYAEACRDLREVRANSYLRTDGQWGGYRQWTSKWSPVLLVVDSTDIDAIRGLTVSPDWRVMGIDGKRTIFGDADYPQNIPQMTTALNCLMALEWPPLQTNVSLVNTITAHTDEDARRVAGVLCAMRLPYAATRYLQEDDSREKERLSAWCWLELAHRVQLHSGHASLLDQYRAIDKVRELDQQSAWPAEERERLSRSLSALGLDSLASEFGAAYSEKAVEHNSETIPVDNDEFSSSMTSAERELRNALMQGNQAESRRLLTDIPTPLKEFYTVLVESPGQAAVSLCSQFRSAIDSSAGLSDERRGEALFYLGCAAIEAGDTPLAVSAFQESAQVAPNIPWREIRALYLMQSSR